MSAFIVNQAFTDLIISTMVEQKYYGTKESQEVYLKSVLKIREDFYRLKSKAAEFEPAATDSLYLDSTERGLNNAVKFIEECLKES
jgi:hypothetical protein